MTTSRPLVVAPPQAHGTVVHSDFALVVGVAALSTLVHYGYMTYRTVKARKEASIRPPDLYATESNCPDEEVRGKFNRTQRAHQNSLEYQPGFLAMLAMAGLKHPKPAAALGAAYLALRIGYMEAYIAGGKSAKRAPWFMGTNVTLLGLTGLCLSAGCAAAYACMRSK